MKFALRILLSIVGLALVVPGMQAQATVPPAAATYSVSLSWTGPAGCAVATPCTYAVYRAPASTGIYALLGSSASQTVSYSDTTVAAGISYIYEIETVQAGANSAPSVAVPVTIPAVPGAPTVIVITIVP
jgi:hypothetical protein